MPDIPVEPGSPRRYPGDMENRVAALEQIARSTAATLERIELRLGGIELRLGGIEQRLDGIDRRLDGADRRMDGFERRLDALAHDQHADFRWLISVMLGTAAALLGVMAHGFHWL